MFPPRNSAMPDIELTTFSAAPLERVFDLSRSIDLHTASTAQTGERAIGGVTSGLIGAGEEVTWRARHFGVWQTLSVRITAFDRPAFFVDTMLRGAFRRMEHRHEFAQGPEGTIMRDLFSYEAPLGLLGRLAEVLFLQRYLQSFLVRRNALIKTVAESEEWRRYLSDA